MREKELTWFDFSDYGYYNPVPVDKDTLTRIISRAEEMVELDYIRDNHEYMSNWHVYLKDIKQLSDDAEWRILVLLHMAILGLKGVAEPKIIDIDDL